MKKSAIWLAFAGTLAATSAAHAHMSYNLGSSDGAGNIVNQVTTGFGNNQDGAINGSQLSQGGAAVAAGNMLWGTGAGAIAPEYNGNLPETFYSGLHTTAAGATRREFGTVSGGVNGTTFLNAANSLSSKINTYNSTAPASLQINPNAQLAVRGNSWNTGDGLDYGITHVSCSSGGSTPALNCLSAGDLNITWSLKNLNSDSTSLLGIAVYGGWDQSATSNRLAAFSGGTGTNTAPLNPQGSGLGTLLWSQTMTNPTDVLTFSLLYNTAEANLWNGEYTVIIGALNGDNSTSAQYYLQNNLTAAVPIPAAVWLFASALGGMGVFGRRKSRLAQA